MESAALLAEEKARKLFAKFAKKWNSGVLKPELYLSSVTVAGPKFERVNATGAVSDAERRDDEESKLKTERKKLAKHQREVMDELVPKKTGREAVIDARKQKGAYARKDDDAQLGEVDPFVFRFACDFV